MRISFPSKGSKLNVLPVPQVRTKVRVLACGVAAIMLAPTGWGAVFEWNGAGGNDNWSTSANWGGENSTVPGILYPTSDFTSDLQFSDSPRVSPNIDINDPFQIKSLTFNSTAPAYTFSGKAIAFQGGGNVITNGSSNLQTFNVGLVLAPAGNNVTYTLPANSGEMEFNGAVSLATNFSATFTARGGRNVTIHGLISNTVGSLSIGRTDAGTLALTNDSNSFSGSLRASTGTISITSIANAGVNSAAGKGNAIVLGQNQNGSIGVGRLLFVGTENASTDRTVQLDTGILSGSLNGGFIIENGTAGTKLTLSGDIVYTSSATKTHGTMRLQGVGNGEISGKIQTTGASLTKSGTGTWILSGADNTYGGGTVVSQGTLLVNNVSGSATGTGAVTVDSVLGGTGRIAPTGTNGFTVNATGTINLSGDNITEDLVLDLEGTGNASFASGARFKFDLAVANVSDVFAFEGLGDSTVTFNNNVIDFTNLGGLAEGNSYTLFTFDTPGRYSGALAIGAGLEGLTGILSYNSQSIVLTVVPEPGTAAILVGASGVLAGMQRRRRCH